MMLRNTYILYFELFFDTIINRHDPKFVVFLG
jgi:hypothetical protein